MYGSDSSVVLCKMYIQPICSPLLVDTDGFYDVTVIVHRDLLGLQGVDFFKTLASTTMAGFSMSALL